MTLLLTLTLLIHPAPPVAHIVIRPVPDQWEATHPYRTPKWAEPKKFTPEVLDWRPPTATPPPLGWIVEQWRPLVAVYFPAEDVERAICLVAYESGGDPNATNSTSGAAGLFQHLPRYWSERSAAAGWAGASIYDPEANVAVAAWLRLSGWQHWVPYQRGLC